MLFQNAIADARSELGDTYEGSYSYLQADMMRYAVDGVREAWRARSSLRYDPETGLLYEAETALPPTLTEDYYDIPLPVEVHSAIMYYIVFRCLSRDVTDAGNKAVADEAKKRFAEIVMG